MVYMDMQLTKREQEIKAKVKEIARNLYFYDNDYVVEREQAMETLKQLCSIIVNENLNINWRKLIPKENCEGQKILV